MPEIKSGKQAKSWSLRSRMRAWFMATTFGVFLISYLLGIPFMDQAYENVVFATLREEEEEFSILFSASDRSNSAAIQIYEDLAHRHPEIRMAFWVWRQDSEERIATVGDQDLIQEFPLTPKSESNYQKVNSSVYVRHSVLPNGLAFGMAMDTSTMGGVLERFHRYAALMAIAAVAVGMILGEVFSRMMSHQLTRISVAVREVRSLKEDLHIALADSPVEIRSVVEALSEMLLAIRDENQSSELMIAGLAHELGSPVQNMLGETEVLLMGKPDSDEYHRLIQIYQEELHQLADAVHNLVTLCASRSGKTMVTDVEKFDLAVEAGFRLLREQAAAGKREVLLEVDYHGDVNIQGDKEGILRALRNLVSNAIAWSPAREVVFVHMDGTQEDCICISVDDAGPGVLESERTKIFEMLYRGHGASGKRVGYGLGLALAHQAISRQGGSIEVTDSPLGGARFSIILPRHCPVSDVADGDPLWPSSSA